MNQQLKCLDFLNFPGYILSPEQSKNIFINMEKQGYQSNNKRISTGQYPKPYWKK